ncbi:MAG: ABC transporter substrate-binding protein [Planctomycetota bacterium]
MIRKSPQITSKFVAALTVVCGLVLAVGCSPQQNTQSPNGSQVITLQLNWRADAQHGGFYAAQLLGEYKAEGLDVKIEQGGPGSPVIPNLVMGRVDFAIANADQILQVREQDADIVGIMAPMQHSPRCIMVHQSSGIESLDQLKDITLAMNEGRTFAQVLKSKVDLTNVRVVPYSGTVAKFVLDEKYAQQGYVFSEPLVARRQGSDPKALMVSELGFDPYTSVVAVNRKRLESDPDLVRKFVAATVRGWEKYLQSPEATNREINRINPEMDLESLDEAAVAIKPLCEMPTGQKFGTMTKPRWNELATQMAAVKAISGEPAEAASQAWSDVFEQAPAQNSP